MVARDPSAPTQYATITYLSGESIYLDAGTTRGLREKSVVDVFRKDSVVAQIEVQYVSSSRAAGKLLRGSPVTIGDSVRFQRVVETAVATSSAASSASAAKDSSAAAATRVATSRRKPRTLNGRIGVRYMDLQTGSSAAGHVTQPALDMRFEGHRMDGSPIGLIIDARAHRQTTGAGRTDGSTRIYQSMLEYQSGGDMPTRVQLGRQLSTVLSPIGFFDGLTVDIDGQHWRYGALGGTQPNYANFAPSAEIREYGGWVQWHNATGATTMFNSTLGAVGSYTTAGINREFALLSTMLVNPKVSFYATQEIDINRGWKKDAEGGKSIVPTSLFATLRVALTQALSVQTGYDSRRSVRLYRDFLTPDIVFDDALRRGYWGGVSLYVPHLYMSADMRTSDGSTVGQNQSNTANITVNRLTSLGIGLRARATSYKGPTVTGTLTSASLEINPFNRIRIESTVGKRDDRRASDGMIPARTTWVGIDADFGIGRSWYVMGSSYREIGATDRLLQQYLGLSWRY